MHAKMLRHPGLWTMDVLPFIPTPLKELAK
jgi:hypothetical protein